MNEKRYYREVKENIRMMNIQTSNSEKDEFIKDSIKMGINGIIKTIKELVTIYSWNIFFLYKYKA